MEKHKRNTTRLSAPAWKWLPFIAVFFFFATPSQAQNSKGDKPASQSPILRFHKIKSKSKGGDHARTGDISGRRRIRTKNASSANHVIYKNSNPASRSRGTSQSSRNSGNAPAYRQRVRSVSAQRARNNVFPQKGPYVNNSAKKPKDPKVYNRTAAGKQIVRRRPDHQQRAWIGNLRGGSLGTVSASRPFVTRGKKNVYWGKVSKGEKPITRDLTGRPVRTRNFHSAALGTGRSDTLKVALRKPSREGSHNGSLRGGYVSISGNGKATTRDISGHRLRLRNGKRSGGFLGGGGYRSASGSAGNKPLPVRPPGMGGGAISRILRRMTGQPSIGGASGIGSFRGRLGLESLSPGLGRQGSGFAGNIKTRRPYRGGGSASGQLFNNNGKAITQIPMRGPQGIGRFQGDFRSDEVAPQLNRGGYGYAGNIKGRRPLKGGGSVSGRFYNNNGRALTVRQPGSGSWGAGSFQGRIRRDEMSPQLSRGGANYAGNLKARRPLKGGGSVSGQFLNNGGRSLTVKAPGAGSRGIGKYQGSFRRDQMSPQPSRGGADYAGNMKGHRPLKGGGSVSGQFLSNDGRPITVRPPGFGSRAIGNFRGKSRQDEVWTPINRGGALYSGNIKAHRPAKGGGSVSGKIWNNDEKPIEVKPPGPGFGRVANFTGKSRRPAYVRAPHSVEKALLVQKPNQVTFAVGGLTSRTKRPDYVKNPSSSEKALKTISPGKAYARMKDYQGNQKMKKFNDSRFHPDSKFAHGNRDNVKADRTLKTNIKLFWARWFKKQDGQPDIVKEKETVPRYDRKEKDLWKALYD